MVRFVIALAALLLASAMTPHPRKAIRSARSDSSCHSGPAPVSTSPPA